MTIHRVIPQEEFHGFNAKCDLGRRGQLPTLSMLNDGIIGGLKRDYPSWTVDMRLILFDNEDRPYWKFIADGEECQRAGYGAFNYLVNMGFANGYEITTTHDEGGRRVTVEWPRR